MSNSTTTFSNDTAWKAFKYSVKFVWWCIKALFKVIGFLFIGYKKYKEYKARKAAERAAEAAVEQERIAAASAVQASDPAAQATAPVDPVAAPAADSTNVKPE
ncbi:hypothetical protein [uncultured Alistipes sp.]|uniref:hypothetical protein n=1 Tax=uncultured Alistipes sp. TaxID=538949 RepID=UPI0025E17EC0|nr:hypothetical protein [uncultured Alistipes sp.]